METEDICSRPPSLWRPERDQVKLAALGKLAEEANELGAIIARCVIQGIGGVSPDTGEPNIEALRKEMADVYAMLDVVQDTLDIRPDVDRVHAKIAHKSRWLDDLQAALAASVSPVVSLDDVLTLLNCRRSVLASRRDTPSAPGPASALEAQGAIEEYDELAAALRRAADGASSGVVTFEDVRAVLAADRDAS